MSTEVKDMNVRNVPIEMHEEIKRIQSKEHLENNVRRPLRDIYIDVLDAGIKALKGESVGVS